MVSWARRGEAQLTQERYSSHCSFAYLSIDCGAYTAHAQLTRATASLPRSGALNAVAHGRLRSGPGYCVVGVVEPPNVLCFPTYRADWHASYSPHNPVGCTA